MPSDDQIVATRFVDGEFVMSVVDVDGAATRDLDLGGIEPVRASGRSGPCRRSSQQIRSS